MTNKQLAERYAEGKLSGTAPRMFIDGVSIYSYGYHFPIATKIKDGVYLFNIDGYSNTTARHKSHVLGALLSTGARIIEAPAVGEGWGGRTLEVSVEVLQREFDRARGKAVRARSERMARVWTNEMRRYDEMIELAKTL